MSGPVKAGSGAALPPSREGDARKGRWTAHRAARRAQFVDAALRVLETQGPDLPMDAVAAEAGVTKPVLYRYFSDKAALVRALGERGTELLFARLLPALNCDGPALTRTREAIGAYFAVIDENPNLYWLLARRSAGEALDGVDPVQHDKEFIAAQLTAVIGDYLRVFGLDSGAAEPWAYGVTGLVQSTGEWWLQRRSMSRVHVVEYVTQLVWAALSGVLRDAGVDIDPEQPLPASRPRLSLRVGRAAGEAEPTGTAAL
ncbi:TetR/AcrR family transcriptional regulator [Actinocrinis puniceicyclus]|uniref:TetR/AcrR family transcriptional regulator n=1 Tax=Actinocrinis puniceicyclus TaxID=977794 RepID=A0A8J7WRC2_9ACTN|nr:TetR/AcrR family transcriptional regulator [Actinocrinis puniceicyclus]MBS2967121.1 TetR/AcrR family transcriptional regulator [Actinocrinis puniceicyclus]